MGGLKLITDYKSVDRDFIDRLINYRKPIGKYICEDDVNGTIIWTAIDNSTGDAWTEEFGSRMMAVRWLHGYRAKNIYGEVLN